MQNPEDVQLAASTVNALLRKGPGEIFNPKIGIILGTGLSDALAAYATPDAVVPFKDIPKFPRASVSSHKGEFVACNLNNTPVIIQNGRFHLYEGCSPREICMGVRVMACLGCHYLIITNAAGSLNPLFTAGNLLCICDIINHTGLSPLTGSNYDAWGDRFPDMSRTFSKKLIDLAAAIALENKINLYKGIYIGVHGPEMETPAETRMYRQWGADAVGMSSVLEIIAARHMGMECLGLSCLTNLNLPDCMSPAPLEEVLAQAQNVAPRLATLIYEIAGRL